MCPSSPTSVTSCPGQERPVGPGPAGRPGLCSHAVVGFGHDESSQTDAAEGTFCVDAASVDTGDIHAVHAVLTLVRVCPHNTHLGLMSGNTQAEAARRLSPVHVMLVMSSWYPW